MTTGTRSVPVTAFTAAGPAGAALSSAKLRWARKRARVAATARARTRQPPFGVMSRPGISQRGPGRCPAEAGRPWAPATAARHDAVHNRMVGRTGGMRYPPEWTTLRPCRARGCGPPHIAPRQPEPDPHEDYHPAHHLQPIHIRMRLVTRHHEPQHDRKPHRG